MRLTNRFAAVGVLAACLSALAACGSARIGPAAGKDVRTAVRLTATEREHLRQGMRTYLESVRGIVDALAERKTALVAEHARKSGMVAVQDVPLWVAATLPPEFVLLGADTHQKFDALAASASGGASARDALGQLQGILANCSACHASYRVVSSPQ